MTKIKSQGTKLFVGTEDADVEAYDADNLVQVKGLRSIGNPDGEAAEIDTTDLDSEATEFMMGLPDNGKFSVSGHAIDDDPGQVACLAAREAQELRWVRVTDSKGKFARFKAIVPRFSNLGAEVNGVKPVEGTFRISGAIIRG